MPDPEATRRGDQRAAEVIQEAPLAPPAPECLDEAQAAAWEDVWRLPVARYWAPSDLPALERLFRLRQLHDTLLRSFEEAPLVAGSQDQLVLNPCGRQANTVHAELLRLEDRFFLSPAHRLKGQISLAAAIEGAKRTAGDSPGEEVKPPRADPRLTGAVTAAAQPLGGRG
jgi:hypothetical protein